MAKKLGQMKVEYVKVKLQFRGDHAVAMAKCSCGDVHEFSLSDYAVNGLKKAPCGKKMFTLLDSQDESSNTIFIEVLKFRNGKRRYEKLIKGLKRDTTFIDALNRMSRISDNKCAKK